MKTNKLIIMGVLVLLACFAMGPSLSRAQGEVIMPVDGDSSGRLQFPFLIQQEKM